MISLVLHVLSTPPSESQPWKQLEYALFSHQPSLAGIRPAFNSSCNAEASVHNSCSIVFHPNSPLQALVLEAGQAAQQRTAARLCPAQGVAFPPDLHNWMMICRDLPLPVLRRLSSSRHSASSARVHGELYVTATCLRLGLPGSRLFVR